MQRRHFLALMASSGLLAGGTTPAQQPADSGKPGLAEPAIDVHTHWYPPQWMDLLAREGPANNARVEILNETESIVTVSGVRQSVRIEHVDLGLRLKAMDVMGVGMQALSLTSPMVYWAPPAFGMKLAQTYNDALSAAHLKNPRRFIGLMTLPMQAPALALEELERAATLPGIRGVYIATHINNKNLDDPSFLPLYARCEALGLPLLLHPIDPLGASRMRNWYLRNFIGNPTDTGVAAASLIFGGVMDAFPKLEVVLPHAGGITPILIGRWDHGSGVRPETKHMRQSPSSYLRRFHYDTVSHSPQIMADIIRQVGADRVVLGSDHPADMSLERPLDFVGRIPGLSPHERGLILNGNASRLLKT